MLYNTRFDAHDGGRLGLVERLIIKSDTEGTLSGGIRFFRAQNGFSDYLWAWEEL